MLAGLGRHAEALDCLAKSTREGTMNIEIYAKAAPDLDPLRDDPASRRSWRGWGWRTEGKPALSVAAAAGRMIPSWPAPSAVGP